MKLGSTNFPRKGSASRQAHILMAPPAGPLSPLPERDNSTLQSMRDERNISIQSKRFAAASSKGAIMAPGTSRNYDKRRNIAKTTKTTFFEGRLPKVACKVEVSNGTTLNVSAVRATDGERFVVVRQNERTAVTRLHSWHAGSAVASKVLADHDIILVDGLSILRSAVAKLARFEDYPVITRPGWSGDSFTLADGQIFQPATACPALMAFAPTPGAFAWGGSLKGWRTQVAKPLADHSLASFMLMVMFAAPILRLSNRVDNFGFEIAGPAGRGKSTLQLLMASAAGPSIGGDGTTYWSSCNATINALETAMSSRNDMTLILDEAGSLPNSAKTNARGDAMRELAFRLGSGRVRQRHGTGLSPKFRLVYVISTNRPLASMISRNHAAEAQAIADRLMTLPLVNDRPHGVFDRCPEQHATTGAFADALRQAASDHYGHALPAFLRYLVRQLSKNPDRLRRFIEGYTEKFIAGCGADLNDGSERRVAEAFGLVAAAGFLAKRAGVLPQGYKPRASALACYELHCSQGRLTRSFDDQLRSLIQQPDTIDLADSDSKALHLDTLQACKVFLRTGRSGNRELLVPRKFRDAVFTHWNAIRHGTDLGQRLKMQKGRNVNSRKVLDGIGGPFYCFDITGLED